MDRREFIKKSGMAVMATAVSPLLASPLGKIIEETTKTNTGMKKIMIIDGGPRKNMNTAAMIEAFANGAKSVSDKIKVKTVRVYDMNCKGCVSCLACKLKNSKYPDVCARKDDFTEPLRETDYADGIVFASPMFSSRLLRSSGPSSNVCSSLGCRTTTTAAILPRGEYQQLLSTR